MTSLAFAITQPLGVRPERHVNNGRRGRDFDHKFVAFYGPLADLQHGGKHALPAVRERF